MLSYVQLQLPAVVLIAGDAPQLQRPHLGDAALERHGQHGVVLSVEAKRDFQRTQLIDLLAPVFDERSRRITFAGPRAEEPELRGLADDEAKLAIDCGARALFHSERHDAQR